MAGIFTSDPSSPLSSFNTITAVISSIMLMVVTLCVALLVRLNAPTLGLIAAIAGVAGPLGSIVGGILGWQTPVGGLAGLAGAGAYFIFLSIVGYLAITNHLLPAPLGWLGISLGVLFLVATVMTIANLVGNVVGVQAVEMVWAITGIVGILWSSRLGITLLLRAQRTPARDKFTVA